MDTRWRYVQQCRVLIIGRLLDQLRESGAEALHVHGLIVGGLRQKPVLIFCNPEKGTLARCKLEALYPFIRGPRFVAGLPGDIEFKSVEAEGGSWRVRRRVIGKRLHHRIHPGDLRELSSEQ